MQIIRSKRRQFFDVSMGEIPVIKLTNEQPIFCMKLLNNFEISGRVVTVKKNPLRTLCHPRLRGDDNRSHQYKHLKCFCKKRKFGLAHLVPRGGSFVLETGGVQKAVSHVEEDFVPKLQVPFKRFASCDIEGNDNVEGRRMMKGDDVGDGVVP